MLFLVLWGFSRLGVRVRWLRRRVLREGGTGMVSCKSVVFLFFRISHSPFDSCWWVSGENNWTGWNWELGSIDWAGCVGDGFPFLCLICYPGQAGQSLSPLFSFPLTFDHEYYETCTCYIYNSFCIFIFFRPRERFFYLSIQLLYASMPCIMQRSHNQIIPKSDKVVNLDLYIR